MTPETRVGESTWLCPAKRRGAPAPLGAYRSDNGVNCPARANAQGVPDVIRGGTRSPHFHYRPDQKLTARVMFGMCCHRVTFGFRYAYRVVDQTDRCGRSFGPVCERDCRSGTWGHVLTVFRFAPHTSIYPL